MKMNLGSSNDLVIYKTQDGDISFNVNVFEETVWLTQKQMAELFVKDRRTITEHINNIYGEEELDKNRTCWEFQHVRKEGNREVKRSIEHYNLDMIISVGYRVKSKRGIQFRQWARAILKQYLINGYAVNESRIKQIQSCIDELVSSQKILRKDVDRIENLLIKLVEKPIIIHNHNHNKINLGTKKLEDKIILLIDDIIKDLSKKMRTFLYWKMPRMILNHN